MKHGAALFVGSLVAMAILSGSRLAHQSAAPHFVYQAMSFLQGRLSIPVDLPNGNDWAVGPDGRVYVSFPPGPALLMVPAVAVAGYQLNDVLFTLPFAALNVALLFLLLERLGAEGSVPDRRGQNALLACLFGFGTVHLACAVRGEVWFTAQIIGTTALLSFLLTARGLRQPLLAGAFFAFGALTRTPLLFAGPFFAWELLATGGRLDRDALRADAPRRLRALGLFLIPCIVAFGLQAAMNQARFGSPFEFGHRSLFHNRINGDVASHGLFSAAYLRRNLDAALLALPRVSLSPLRIDFDPRGMSLFLTTPLLLWLLLPSTWRPGSESASALQRQAGIVAALILLPALFYVNTGFAQFGYRFSLDALPLAFVVLAIGVTRRGPGFWTAGAAGVAVNVWGALAFR